MTKETSLLEEGNRMSGCFDNFERQAAVRIDGSRKSLPELVVELRTMLESRLFIGEEVRFGNVLDLHVGRIVDCIDMQSADGVERKYTVLCNKELHKNLDPARLKRAHEFSDEDLERFIKRTAAQSFVTHVWSVKAGFWNDFVLVALRNTHIFGKRDEETKKKERRSTNLWRAVLISMALSLFLILGIVHYKLYTRPLAVRPNHHFAEDALKAIGKMNETTSDHFWKRLVIDEKINLSDPSVLQGIAHLFVFESAQSNRTTLREYVDRMPADPPTIFFAFGESKEELERVPAVRSLTEDGHEVLLLTSSLDRKALQMITWFESNSIMDVRWYEQSKRPKGSSVD
ncbi:Molecular chaperone HtpG [Aphelenchoides fujianensis]|nr:Molecular chaperone HtpG [Aphelenchoides fujianensis]